MSISLFQQIIKSLPRRKIASLVSTHESDKWVKRFSTFDHLMVMIYAQLSGQTGLRDLEASFNASPARHYHLGTGAVKRSTLSDANASRPSAVFEAILETLLADMVGREDRRAGELVQILDSTTIGLFAKTHNTNERNLEPMGPFSQPNGHYDPRLLDKFAPGIAAYSEDFLV